MARTEITPTVAVGAYGGTVVVPWTAADQVDGNQFTLAERELVLIRNVGASSRQFTITSTPIRGRPGDITGESIAAGATKMWGPTKAEGWMQTNGKLYFSGNNAEVEFAVLRFPVNLL